MSIRGQGRFVDFFPEPMLLLRLGGTIQTANRAFTETLGWEHGELAGHPLSRFVTTPEKATDFVRSCSGTSSRLVGALSMRHRDGSEVPCRVDGAALRRDDGPERLILLRVTIRDCVTGVALAPAVNSLVTFAAGGTLHESVSGGGFAPGQRSDGHGTWTHNGGHTYDQRFVSMINFTTNPGPGPGFEAGWMKVEHTVTMIDADHIESVGRNRFFRLNGEVYRTGCSTAAGTRFE